ncbi:MAG TPA: MBL fold metallo-hydrolase [Chloroflexota bacterium]|nr:MBL fold metallo-hydrolase [Chloroflexota bacterium]
MELTWLGHSCFRLRARDLTIVTDPFGSDLGLALGKVSADVVTVSHAEPNHNAINLVDGSPRVVAGPGEYELAGVMITGVATPRPPGQSRDVPRNTAYLVELDEVTICHLGDLAAPLGSDQVAVVKDADVLLLPVGGHCTIDAAQAAEIAAQVEPKLVVPMHYLTPGVRLELDPVDRFCREIGAAELTPQPRLNVTRSNLPDQLTVVLLEPRK